MSEIEPGHYWARRKLDEPGRRREWTVVLVEDTSAWSVWEVGSDVISDQGVWEFGPHLLPPAANQDAVDRALQRRADKLMRELNAEAEEPPPEERTVS